MYSCKVIYGLQLCTCIRCEKETQISYTIIPAETSSSSSFPVQGSVFHRIDALLGEFRVGGGVHDSYTFQCGLVGSFTSPGIDTR